MSNFARNNNHYWDNGAFCENCGILTGNVTNNGVLPIWHEGCKPGCTSVWQDQDPLSDDDEEPNEYHANPLFELPLQRSHRVIEYDQRQELSKTPTERTDEFELWAEEYGLITDKNREQEEREEMAWEDDKEYRHPYHEDDEELEREAREEYRRQIEEQDREEDEREEREFRESRYKYYDTDDSDYDSDS